MIRPHAPIVHVYYSDLAHESRLLRAARAVVDSCLASTAIGIGYLAPGLASEQEMAPGVRFRRLPPSRLTRGGGKLGRLLRWPLWCFAAAREAARERPSIIQCHSLAALPVGLLTRFRWPGVRIIYDAHELESERNNWSPMLRRLAKIVERRLIRQADALIVVGPMIARWYADQYGIAVPAVVRNVPDLQTAQPSSSSLRGRLGLADDILLFVYVGVIGAGRGIPALINAFADIDPKRHVAFVGYGPLTELVENAAKRHPTIHYIPPVPSDEVTSFIRDADVGLSIIEDVALSYRYCLPNKLFEYRYAGLAVLAADLPEMRALIEQYGGGWLVEGEFEAIATAIACLSRADIQTVIAEATVLFGWSQERATYLEVITKLLSDRLSKPSGG